MVSRVTQTQPPHPTPAPAAPDEPSAAPAPAVPVQRSLTEDLQAALEHANGQAITVQALMDVLNERGYAMVLLVVTFPFLLPVPTMGLSAPAGLAVVLYGLAVTLNVRPWLPGFLARRQISYPVLERVVRVASTTGRRIERMLKPRLRFMLWPGVNALIGISLMISGFLLALPAPNTIPAAAVLLLLLGLIERDGVFVLIGQFLTLALVVFCLVLLYLIWKVGWAGVKVMFGLEDGAPATTQPTTVPVP